MAVAAFTFVFLTRSVSCLSCHLLSQWCNVHYRFINALLCFWSKQPVCFSLQNGRLPCDADLERLTLNEGYINGTHHVSMFLSPLWVSSLIFNKVNSMGDVCLSLQCVFVCSSGWSLVRWCRRRTRWRNNPRSPHLSSPWRPVKMGPHGAQKPW